MTTTLRGKLPWEATDALTVTLGLNYSEGEATSVSPLSLMSPAARLRGNPALSSDVTMPGIVASDDNLRISHDVDPLARSDGFGQSLKVSYDFANDFTLTSITSNDEFQLDDRLDVDRTSYAQLNNFQGGRFRRRRRHPGVSFAVARG